MSLADLGMTTDDLREAIHDGTLAPSRGRVQPAAGRGDDLADARHRRAVAEEVVRGAHLRGEAWAAVQGPALIRMAERAVERALARRRAAVDRRPPSARRRRRHSSADLRAALGLPSTNQ